MKGPTPGPGGSPAPRAERPLDLPEQAELDAELQRWLLSDQPTHPADLRDRIGSRVSVTPQRRVPEVWMAPEGLRTAARTLIAVAAVIAVLVIGPGLLTRLPLTPDASPGPTAVNGAIGAYQTRSVVLNERPRAVTATASIVWVTADGATLLALDPDRLLVTQVVRLPADSCGSPTVSPTMVWVASCDGRLFRVDPADGSVVSQPGAGLSLALVAGSIWALDAGESSLQELDASSGAVLRTFGLEGQSDAVLAGLGAIWVLRPGDGRVIRLDPAGGETVSVTVGDRTYAGATGTDYLWVADFSTGALVAISGTGAIASSVPAVGTAPRALAVAGGGVWVLVDGGITVVDEATFAIRDRLTMSSEPTAIAGQGGTIWMVDGAARTLVRVEAGP